MFYSPNENDFHLLKMSQKIGEQSFTKQIENFSESIDISKKNHPPKIGEKSPKKWKF